MVADNSRTMGGGWPSYILPRIVLSALQIPPTDELIQEGVPAFSACLDSGAILSPHCQCHRGHWFPNPILSCNDDGGPRAIPSAQEPEPQMEKPVRDAAAKANPTITKTTTRPCPNPLHDVPLTPTIGSLTKHEAHRPRLQSN